MLSKAKIKQVRALERKKGRQEEGLFVVEGNKLVTDMLSSDLECKWLIARSSWMATQGDIPVEDLLIADDGDIEKLSFLKSPQDVFGVFRMPVWDVSSLNTANQLLLCLDGVQDPGNLGSIIRLADWFGIENIVCSLDTADVFNPKVVQATMGALAHVKVYYTDLEFFLKQEADGGVPIYGTFLDGENMYEKELSKEGIIVMGNEGNGIRPRVETLIHERLYIPNYPDTRETTESLNVAIAASVICAEFRRRL